MIFCPARDSHIAVPNRYGGTDGFVLLAGTPREAPRHRAGRLGDAVALESGRRGLGRVYPPQSKASAKQWTAGAAANRPTEDDFGLVIENLDGALVGNLGLHDCDPVGGTFSYGVSIAREHRRSGDASDAIGLVLRYFFEERGYRKAWVHVYAFNEASIRLHERLGFRCEGRLRRMAFTRGRYHDIVVLGLFAEEFAAQGVETTSKSDTAM